MSLLAAVPCAFSLRDRSGAETEKGQAEVDLDKEAISVRPLRSQPFVISLVDMVSFKAQDYRIEMTLQGGHALLLFDLGQKFDDFASAVTAARNEMILKFLLMGESERKKAVIADVAYSDSSGSQMSYEGCSVGFYETCMIFSPGQSDPVKLRYGDIAKWDAEDYSILVATDSGQSFSLSKLGKEFDAVASEISEAMNALDLRTQSLLKTVAPAAEPLTVRSLARVMRDGRAAAKEDIDSISPAVWASLENKLAATPLRESYEFLKSIGRVELISAGVKRGLMGDLTGDYLWFLVPIFGEGGTPGNAVAFESVRLPSGTEAETNVTAQESEVAGATYFFRIAGRTEYPVLPLPDLQTRATAMIRDISRLMLEINFRREPIYLSEDQLADPSFARYMFALSRLDSLKRIRQLYIGRVIHSSIDQWRADVRDLLSFNVTSRDDSEKWRKGQ